MSRQYRMMQNLKKYWLVVSKLTWGIWRMLTRALKSLKNLHFDLLLLHKVYNVWAKMYRGIMALTIDSKFEGKLTCTFQNDMRNLANFYWLKNSDFILESKIAELNQNKNSKQLGRPDAVKKLYFYLGREWIA